MVKFPYVIFAPKSNAELVAKLVRIVKLLGREIAKPDEVRQILGLKGIDKVNF